MHLRPKLQLENVLILNILINHHVKSFSETIKTIYIVSDGIILNQIVMSDTQLGRFNSSSVVKGKNSYTLCCGLFC